MICSQRLNNTLAVHGRSSLHCLISLFFLVFAAWMLHAFGCLEVYCQFISNTSFSITLYILFLLDYKISITQSAARIFLIFIVTQNIKYEFKK